ncbi:DUF4126 domain-containing protein [Sphingorhabdus sp.]|uniref:DUF4126 domain-containing protein n=1 Tax=Sphingorhabdus sp. TaxID=1902408 RepID=UPI003983BA8E
MGVIEILGLAGSLSLLSGWRFYLTIFATGLAMHFNIVPLPENLQMLDVLANPWVLGISALGAVAEFFADKIAWLDSIWDGLHTIVRPVGGAMLALAVVDSSDPAWQVIAFLLGGGAAFASHATKASARAAVNTSPEPFSNVIVSTVEDVATGGLLVLAFANPVAALVISLILLGLAIWALWAGYRAFRRMFPKSPSPPSQLGPQAGPPE